MKRWFLLAVVTGWLGAAQAGEAPVGDAKAGEAKAAVCAACHGPGGNSFNPQWPSLAGQGAPYIVKQLSKFKSGERANPIMAGQVASLSEQDMHDLAAYFSTQKAGKGAASPDLAAVGEKLYNAGDVARGIPACSACHGPQGAGVAGPAYPRVGGQQAAYSEAQLIAYRAGTRKAPMMSVITAKLTDDEIRALASYLAGLH